MEQAETSRHSASKSQYRDLSMKISIGDTWSIYPGSTVSVASANERKPTGPRRAIIHQLAEWAIESPGTFA